MATQKKIRFADENSKAKYPVSLHIWISRQMQADITEVFRIMGNFYDSTSEFVRESINEKIERLGIKGMV
jgi:hypothetical protein